MAASSSARDAKRTKREEPEGRGAVTKTKEEVKEESEYEKYEKLRAFAKTKAKPPESPVRVEDEEPPDWGSESPSPGMKVSKVNWTFMVGGGGAPLRDLKAGNWSESMTLRRIPTARLQWIRRPFR